MNGTRDNKLNRHTCQRILFACIGLQAILLTFAAVWASPNPDEMPNLVAGASYVRNGEFGVYNVNPPFVKMIAALPTCIAGMELPAIDRRRLRPEFDAGLAFYAMHGHRAERYLIYSRLIMTVFPIIGTVFMFLIGEQLLNHESALYSAICWAFSPLVLYYGAVFSFDIAASVVGLFLLHSLLKWREKRTPFRCLIVGFALGCCLSIKLTWLVVGPSFIASVLLIELCWKLHKNERISLTIIVSEAFAILFVALVVLNSTYGFQGVGTQLGEYRFHSKILTGSNDANNRFASSLIGALPVPLPADLVAGADMQAKDIERGREAYRFGEWQEQGVWWYYIAGYCVKAPLVMLVASAFGLFCWYTKEPAHGMTAALSVALLAAVSSQVNFNEHFRYALILYGQVCLFSGVGIAMLRTRLLRCATLSWVAITPFFWLPVAHGYHNPLIGSMRVTADLMGGSAGDWYSGWWQARELAVKVADKRTILVLATKWVKPNFHVVKTTVVVDWDDIRTGDGVDLLISTKDRQLLERRRKFLTPFYQESVASGVELYRFPPGVNPSLDLTVHTVLKVGEYERQF